MSAGDHPHGRVYLANARGHLAVRAVPVQGEDVRLGASGLNAQIFEAPMYIQATRRCRKGLLSLHDSGICMI